MCISCSMCKLLGYGCCMAGGSLEFGVCYRKGSGCANLLKDPRSLLEYRGGRGGGNGMRWDGMGWIEEKESHNCRWGQFFSSFFLNTTLALFLIFFVGATANLRICRTRLRSALLSARSMKYRHSHSHFPSLAQSAASQL